MGPRHQAARKRLDLACASCCSMPRWPSPARPPGRGDRRRAPHRRRRASGRVPAHRPSPGRRERGGFHSAVGHWPWRV